MLVKSLEATGLGNLMGRRNYVHTKAKHGLKHLAGFIRIP